MRHFWLCMQLGNCRDFCHSVHTTQPSLWLTIMGWGNKEVKYSGCFESEYSLSESRRQCHKSGSNLHPKSLIAAVLQLADFCIFSPAIVPVFAEFLRVIVMKVSTSHCYESFYESLLWTFLRVIVMKVYTASLLWKFLRVIVIKVSTASLLWKFLRVIVIKVSTASSSMTDWGKLLKI